MCCQGLPRVGPSDRRTGPEETSSDLGTHGTWDTGTLQVPKMWPWPLGHWATSWMMPAP